MIEFESDSIEGIARSALTDGGRGNYDPETLDAIIEENLWQAARDGLDDDAVADPLLRREAVGGSAPGRRPRTPSFCFLAKVRAP